MSKPGLISSEDNRKYFEGVVRQRVALLVQYLKGDSAIPSFVEFAQRYADTGRMDYPFGPNRNVLESHLQPLRAGDEPSWATFLWKMRTIPDAYHQLVSISPFAGRCLARIADEFEYDNGIVIQPFPGGMGELRERMRSQASTFRRIGDTDYYVVEHQIT